MIFRCHVFALARILLCINSGISGRHFPKECGGMPFPGPHAQTLHARAATVQHLMQLGCTSFPHTVCISSYQYMTMIMFDYESQPVGLAKVIDASEGSLGGPGGHVPGGNWVTVGFNPPWSAFRGLERKLRCAPKHCFLHSFLLTSVSGLCEKRGNTRIFGC